MSSTSQLYSSFIALARRWPYDALRPDLSFGAALRAATHRVFLARPPAASIAVAQPPTGRATTPTPGGEAAAAVAAAASGSKNKQTLHQALRDVDDLQLAQSQGSLKTLSAQEEQYAHAAIKSLENILNGAASKQVSRTWTCPLMVANLACCSTRHQPPS